MKYTLIQAFDFRREEITLTQDHVNLYQILILIILNFMLLLREKKSKRFFFKLKAFRTFLSTLWTRLAPIIKSSRLYIQILQNTLLNLSRRKNTSDTLLVQEFQIIIHFKNIISFLFLILPNKAKTYMLNEQIIFSVIIYFQ